MMERRLPVEGSAPTEGMLPGKNWPQFDRFVIRKELGRGGFGEVYQAFDPRLDREVALKVIRQERLGNRVARERFLREARAAAGLNHAHVVHIHELIELPDDGQVIVMEFVAGRRLSDEIDSGDLTLDRAFQLLSQITSGLAAAHREGILHRDLKAENVMVSRDGDAKILDFGLAKRLASGESTLTTDGHVLGTLHAMAPEQLDNKDADFRADLFSLGSLAYHLVTGAAPFLDEDRTKTAIKVISHRQDPANFVDGRVPTELSELIDQLLEKDPDRRPQSAEEVVSRLERLSNLSFPATTIGSAISAGPDVVTQGGKTTLEEPQASRTRTVRLSWWFLALVLMAGFTGIEYLLPSAAGPPTVAILGFEDRGDSAGTVAGLAEILGADLRTGGGVKLVDEERIAEVRNDLDHELSWTSGQALEPAVLDDFNRHLATDFYIAGTLEQKEDQWQFRLSLWTRAEGHVEWEKTFVHPVGDLFSLTQAASSELRQELDIEAPDPAQQRPLRDLFPANRDALALYFQGRDLLRRLKTVEALDILKRATAIEPQHPRLLTAMAAALWENGAAVEAEETARLALEHAHSWPRPERLRIAGRLHEITGDWSAAAEVYLELFQDLGNFEDGLRLAEAQIESGLTDAALETLDALKLFLLSDRGTARIALAEARARYDLREYVRSKTLAEQAATLAEGLNASFLAARARFAQGRSLARLYDSVAALEVLERVSLEYARTGYEIGVQETFHLIALLHVRRDELAEAERALDRFIAFWDHGSEAFPGVSHLCNVLTNLGEHSAVRAILHRTLAQTPSLGRFERADADLILGITAQALGELEKAKSHYQAAAETYRELQDAWSLAVALTNLGELSFLNGDLSGAMVLHEQALAINQEQQDPDGAAYDQFRIGRVEASMGLASASARYQTALDLMGEDARPSDAARIWLAQAEFQISESNLGVAAQLARSAYEVFLEAEMIDDAIKAQAVVGYAYFAQGKLGPSRKLAQGLLGHAERSESVSAKLAVAILDAQLQAAAGREQAVEEALMALQDLSVTAADLGYLGVSFEAQLARGEAQLHTGRLADAKSTLEPLIADASRRDYGMVVRRAEQLLGRG